MLDVAVLQTGVLAEARQYDGRTVLGGGVLQLWQYDGQRGPGGLEDLQDDGELGDEPQRLESGPVQEAVEDRVSGVQPSDGLEVVEVVELHGEP